MTLLLDHRLCCIVTLLVALLGVSACSEPSSGNLAELRLRLHLSPLAPNWISTQSAQLMMETGDGDRVKISSADWTMIQKDGYQEGVVSISGAWRGPLRFTLDLRETPSVSHTYQAHINAHPELDYLKQLLLHDPIALDESPPPIVDIYLQPLTFLSLSPAHSWINAVGLSSRFWWSTPHQETTDINQEARELLLASWSTMNIEGLENSSLTEVPFQRWRLITERLHEERPNLDWGRDLSHHLHAQYNGRPLNKTLARLLVNTPCALSILSKWSLSIRDQSSAEPPDAPRIPQSTRRGEDVVESRLEQTLLSDNEWSSCEADLQERLYLERPKVSISPNASESNELAPLRELSMSVFSLSEIAIEDIKLEARRPHLESLTLMALESSNPPRDAWTLDHRRLPQQIIKYELDWRQVNRPQVTLEVMALNALGSQSSATWTTPLLTPITAQLMTLSGVITPWDNGELIARPLLDHLSSHHLARRGERLPPQSSETTWRVEVDQRGRAELEINGYEGPLWLEAKHPNWGSLTAISVPSIGERPPIGNSHLTIDLIGVLISPISAFGGWLTHILSPSASSLSDVNVTLLDQWSSSTINIYDRFDRAQLWLSSMPLYTSLSFKPLYASPSSPSSSLAQRSSIIQEWEQRSLEALARWGRCGRGLRDYRGIEERSISSLWKIGASPLEEELQENSEGLSESQPLLERALTLWEELSLSACLSATDPHQPEQALEALRRVSIQRLLTDSLDAGREVMGLESELSLNAGIWAKSLDLRQKWRASKGSSISIDLSASRGIRALGFNVDSDDRRDPSSILTPLAVEPLTNRDHRPLCLWGPPLSFEESLRERDPSLTMTDGAWRSLNPQDLRELYPHSGESEAYDFAWAWLKTPSVGAAPSELPSMYPLPCQLSLSMGEGGFDDGLYTLQLTAKLWGSDELVERSLSVEIDQGPPSTSSQLIELPAESDWREYQEPSTNDPEMILSHWVSSLPVGEQSPLHLQITAHQPLRCLSSRSREPLLAPIRIGELSIDPFETSSPLDSLRRLSSPIILSELTPTTPYRTSRRYSKREGGDIYVDRFTGYWAFQTRLALTEEGTSVLYLRCEDDLGQSRLSRTLLTIDTEPPIITSAHLVGVNEALIRDGAARPLRGVTAEEVWRDIDLLDQPPRPLIWARWINHWLLCAERCPSDALRSLTLSLTAEDRVWESQELQARVEGVLYTTDSETAPIERREEKLISKDLGYFNNQGALAFNLYELLSKMDFTGFAPTEGRDLYLSLEMIIYDPAGQESRLPLSIQLRPTAPMVALNYLPAEDPLDELLLRGELSGVLNGDLGRVHIENPHTLPVEVRLYLPVSHISLSQEMRESGLTVSADRLFESCLFENSNTFNPLLRLVDYTTQGESSIVGRCVSLLPTPPSEQRFTLQAEQWRSDLGGSVLVYLLLPGESLELDLPRFSPSLPDDVRRLVLSPDILATPSSPSPFQRRRLPETSIFQRTITCDQCAPSFIAGNQIISLISYEQSFSPHSQSDELYAELRETFDLSFESPSWSLSVSIPEVDASSLLTPLLIDLSGDFSIY